MSIIIGWAVIIYLLIGLGLYDKMGIAYEREQREIPNLPMIVWVTILPLVVGGALPMFALKCSNYRFWKRLPPERIHRFIHIVRQENSYKVERVSYLNSRVTELEREVERLRGVQVEDLQDRVVRQANRVLNQHWLKAVEAARESMAVILTAPVTKADVSSR